MPAAGTANILRLLRKLTDVREEENASDADLIHRFVRMNDRAALTTLLERHGPMVYGVCHRLLGNDADADDVFQATFLVLIRRAGSIRRAQSLGSWLHGVALRLAQRARADACRRQRHQSLLAKPTDSNRWACPDIRQILDEEVERLHEKYRAPVVLCYFEGKTIAEAAEQLGWPHGTVCGRLARARARLKWRLTRRGLAPVVGTAALPIASSELLATVPPTLLSTSIQLASLLASPEAASVAGLSGSVAALVEGAMKTLLITKVKAAAVLMTVGIVMTGTAVWATHWFAPQAKAVDQEEKAKQDQAVGTARGPRVDVYGDPIPAEAISRLGTLRFRHGDFVGFLRYSADGKRLISQGGDGVRIWDAASGKELHTLAKEAAGGGNWHYASVSPDGKTLATANDSGMNLWKIADATLFRSKAGGKYYQVEFSPDGTSILTLRYSERPYEQILELIEMKTGSSIWSTPITDMQAMLGRFANNGKSIFLAGTVRKGDKHLAQIRDTQTGREEQEIDLGNSDPSYMAASPDGSLVAVGCRERGGEDFNDHVRVFEMPSGKQRFQIQSPPEQDPMRQKIFSSLLFTRDGKSLITACGSDALVFWDMATGNEQKRLGRHMTAARDLTFSPDGKHLAVARIADVKIVDMTTGAHVIPLADHVWGVNFATLAAAGKTATTIAGLSVVTWDVATGKEIKRHVMDQKSAIEQWSGLSRDGRTAYRVNNAEKSLYIVNLSTGSQTGPIALEGEGKWAWFAGASPDRKLLASFNQSNKTFSLIDGTTGKVVQKLHDPGLNLRRVHFTSDGKTLVACCADHTAQFWDVASGTKIRQIGPMGQANSQGDIGYAKGGGIGNESALSPDGKQLAAGSNQRCLVLFDTTTGQEIRRSEPLPNGVDKLAFSADGRMILCNEWRDPVIHLFEVATAKRRHSLSGHRGGCNVFGFSPESSRLISGSWDGTALVWDLTGRLSDPEWSKALSETELDACWAELAGEDAEKAYRAVRRMASTPDASATFLRKRMKPTPQVDEARIARLIVDLDSDKFETRAAAFNELKSMSETAQDYLNKAIQSNPPSESRRRLQQIVDEIAQQSRHLSPEARQVIRAIEVLELSGIPAAWDVLGALAKGAATARQTKEAKAALDRVERVKLSFD